MNTGVVSSELFKLRTLRGPWIIGLAVAAVPVAAIALNFALLGKPGQPELVPDALSGFVRGPGRLVGGAALLLGLLLSTGEYRHRTILTTRLALPRPAPVVLGKATAAVIAGIVLAVLVEVITFGGTAILFPTHDVAFQPLRHAVPAATASVLAVAALHALAGVGIGELARNPALAVGGVLGWAFIVEGALPVLFREPHLERWLPAGATRAALSVGLPHASGDFAPAAGFALLAGYATVLLAAGLARARFTDP
jgi:ABC-2 type transport system permease protein